MFFLVRIDFNIKHYLDTISSTLRDLILRDNNYDTNTFSHSSRLFDGVRTINGKLDLQYSRFNMSIQLKGNCLFDLFNNITTLDLSFVQFYSVSNNIEIHLTHLLKCRTQINHQRHGKQLLNLYLRRLNLQQLPTWFNQDRFPRLTQLDLSYNKIYSIDLRTFTTLDSISLAYNPLEFDKLFFRSNFIYNSINLRSTIQNQTFNLKNRIERLFKLTTNLDYSENYGNIRNNITKFHINIDFSDQVSLNLSQTNIYSFEINDPSRLDDLFRLDLSLNYLIRLNLEKQSKLSYLDCSNQNLQTLILSRQYSRLIELKCSNNSLETIENFSLFEHENLKLIDLSYNSIKSLNILFSNLKSRYLHTINLKSNLIEKISSNMFHKKLISLYFIDLSSNQINSIQNYSFQSPNLQILDLTNNPLKDIEVKFISTSSLRLFYIVNHTQQLIDRCKKSKLYDNLLLIYIRWFEQNGTYMKSRSIKEINVDQCLIYYSLNNKNKWINIYNKYHIKNLSFYIIIIMIIIGIGIGIIYLYKKTRIEFFTRLQRYSPLDEHSLVDNVDDINHEDNEIVMNLSEVPFNVNVRS